MRIIVTISVALNLLLLTTIVAARVDLGRRASSPERPSDTVRSEALLRGGLPAATAAGIREYYESLREQGLDRAATRPLVALWVHRDIAFNRYAGPRYWRPFDDTARAAAHASFEREAGMRAALEEIYGPSIVRDPDFHGLFFPLGRRFDFLSSHEQVAVREWQLARASAGGSEAELRRVREASLCHRPATEGPRPAVPAARESDALAILLGEERALELEMRLSATADRLRELELDETLFRRAFELLRALETAADPRSHLEYRMQLREVLGDVRFDRVWAQQDRLYEETRRLLGRHDVPDHHIRSAYSIMSRSQEALVDLLSRPGKPDGVRAEALEIASREQTLLAGLLGEELAADLVRARQTAFRVRPSNRSDC